MCGIAGIAFADTDKLPDQGLLSRMCAAIEHRGPDSSGAWIQPGVGIAARRLSIVGVEDGDQPILNEDGTVGVVFNGEIYNDRELRQQLVRQGHRFTTGSDTETLVHLYEEHGVECVKLLHGMFALAIWDARKKRLLLARDRLGVKPLYYHFTPGQLLFGSELKAILQDDAVEREVHPLAIHQLMTLGHILPPNTAFAGIQELPPASLLSFESGKLHLHRYWNLDIQPTGKFDRERDLPEVTSRIRSAVQRRLRSEVPLGAFLSGGIDSSVVVAMMSQLVSEPIQTFAIGFDDPSFNELPFARAVARHCGTKHRELIVKPDVPQIMDRLIAHHDAPFYDTSAIPMYYLSQFAGQHVTVALSGDGGDELFAGYNIFLANRVSRYLRHTPRWLAESSSALLTRWLPESPSRINPGRVAREFLKGLSLGPLERYTRWATKIKRETREQLYQADELRQCLGEPDHALLRPYMPPNATTELSQLLRLATLTELPADMLRKVDRMSMAHSIEVRSPLLDHTLFEYAGTLPDDAKLRRLTKKFALREVARELLPAEVVTRRKRGFSVPIDRWLRNELRSFAQAILLDPVTTRRGLFHQSMIDQLLADHFQAKIARGREIWTLMTIEWWLRAYIDQFDHRVSNPPPLDRVVESPTKGTLR